MKLLNCGFSVLLAAASLLNSSVASAQEEPQAGVQVLGITAGGEAMSAEAIGKIAESAASFSFGSPAGGMSFGSMGGVDPNDRSQLFNLLSNKSVRDELKLTDGQYDGVKKIVAASQKMEGEAIRKLLANRNPGEPIRLGGGAFGEIQEESKRQAEAALEEILLPEQLNRVRQLAYQVDVSQEGLSVALTEGRLGEEIGVHDNQKQYLRDKAAEIEAKAAAAILKIRAAARAELFAELTPDQKKAAEELLGDYFEYQEISLSKQLRNTMRELRSKSDTNSDKKNSDNKNSGKKN